GIINGHVLYLPEGILCRNLGVVDFHVLYVLEHILAITLQTVHVYVMTEHEGIGAAMQLEVPGTDAAATPKYLVGVVHRYVLDVDLAHLTEHLRRVNNRVGHLQMVAIPQCRTASDIEI